MPFRVRSASLQPSSASCAPSGDQATGLRFRSLSSGGGSDTGSEPSGPMTVLVQRPSACCWVTATREPSGDGTPTIDGDDPSRTGSLPSAAMVYTYCSAPAAA